MLLVLCFIISTDLFFILVQTRLPCRALGSLNAISNSSTSISVLKCLHCHFSHLFFTPISLLLCYASLTWKILSELLLVYAWM